MWAGGHSVVQVSLAQVASKKYQRKRCDFPIIVSQVSTLTVSFIFFSFGTLKSLTNFVRHQNWENRDEETELKESSFFGFSSQDCDHHTQGSLTLYVDRLKYHGKAKDGFSFYSWSHWGSRCYRYVFLGINLSHHLKNASVTNNNWKAVFSLHSCYT